MGFWLVDQLVVKLLNYGIELQNWIRELSYLFIETLIRNKFLEFIYWNIGWTWINSLDWIYYKQTLDTHSLHSNTGNIYRANIEHLFATRAHVTNI